MPRDTNPRLFRRDWIPAWAMWPAMTLLVAVAVGPARADDAAAPVQPAVPEASTTPPPAPLHERVDALVEAASPGTAAPLASDAEFLRRAYLDLNGTIPDAATARAFLDDADPNKRTALIDRLLASPRFARHMQHTFDVMWLERRRGALVGKGVADADWKAYLYKSFADNKPLDQLIREILSADGADPALRPAAKFYLDRDAEPNLLARDVGRLFFGRDLQCTVSRSSDRRRLLSVRILRADGVRQSRHGIYRRQEREHAVLCRAGRWRSEFQVGVYR